MILLRGLYQLLSPSERRDTVILGGMILCMALLEMAGVASVMPFIAVLANPESVESNRYLHFVYSRLGFTDPGQFLFFLGWVVFLAVIFSTLFKALTSYAMLRYLHFRIYSLGKRLVEGYLRQPYEWFLRRHSADLGKNVVNEVSLVVGGALLPLMQLLADGSIALAMLLLVVVVDPLLALYVGVALGAGYAATYLFLRKPLARLGRQRLEADQARFRNLTEAFSGIKDVKVKGLEDVFVSRFDRTARDLARFQIKGKLAAQMPKHAVEILAFGGMLLVVLYLMRRPEGLAGALPVIALYAFAGYRLVPALHQFYAQLSHLRFAGPAVKALQDDFASLAVPTKGQAAGPARMPLEQSIVLQGISYRYPDAVREAVNGVDLVIPARSSIGLVGSTGSGKSTTVDIITGLLRPQSGEVLIDGRPLTDSVIRSWQRGIGYVPQQIYLADATIAANIAFGVEAEEIDPDAVERAARIANIHEFITRDLPKGYETEVGERGVRLSGGQRQRIGIARALYHEPHTLVMDEATSALDNVTEQAVMEAVQVLGHRITIIIVAHRLSTVRACDTIFLFEQGRLIGQGDYEALLSRNAGFRDFVLAGEGAL